MEATPPASEHNARRLSDWEAVGSATFVTVRLADSLPDKLQLALRRDGQFAADPPGAISATYSRFAARLRRVDEHLDAGHGCCAFRDPVVASLMAEALRAFDGDRYDLWCWCIMPSHAHVVLSLCDAGDLEHAVQSWRRSVGVRANHLLGRTGSLFQKEYLDHLIQTERHFQSICGYVLRNPAAAGLRNWPWTWQSDGLREGAGCARNVG